MIRLITEPEAIEMGWQKASNPYALPKELSLLDAEIENIRSAGDEAGVVLGDAVAWIWKPNFCKKAEWKRIYHSDPGSAWSKRRTHE